MAQDNSIMNRWSRFILGIVLGLVGVGALAFFFVLREPTYQGRTLTAWLGDLRWTGGAQHERAAEALRHFGTNALPDIVDILGSRHSRFRQKIAVWLNRQQFLKLQVKVPPDLHWQAACAFRVLGPTAQPAVPGLAELLRDGMNPGYVSSSLAAIGPAALPALMAGMKHRDLKVRIAATAALCSLQTHAAPALPVLLETLRQEDKQVRELLAQSLADIDRQRNQAIPVLIQNLTDHNPEVRRISAVALGGYGARAQAAVPALRQSLRDAEVLVAKEASIALIKVNPQLAAEAGLPSDGFTPP